LWKQKKELEDMFAIPLLKK
jgi:superfamily I DNA and/or RNA helicase